MMPIWTARTVWKAVVPIADTVTIRLPKPFTILHVACQSPGTLTVWAEVDSRADHIERTLTIVGTGRPVPDDVDHLATCIDGPFVWHVYVPRVTEVRA